MASMAQKILLVVVLSVFMLPIGELSVKANDSVLLKYEKTIDLEKYRIYPFQWVLPEYYYKAETSKIMEEPVSDGFSRVEFFGLSAGFPKEFTYEIKEKNDRIILSSKSGERIIIIRSSDSAYSCSDEDRLTKMDYCSAFKTSNELFQKMFTLTPEDVRTTGDAWIVHSKGSAFKNIKKIRILSGKNFTAYEKIVKDQRVKESKFARDLTVFHSFGPKECHIIISFPMADGNPLGRFVSTLDVAAKR
jgi:hypothetical protein